MDAASPLQRLGGKILRPPRTLRVLLAPRIQHRTQAIERLVNRRRFSATRRSLQRRNPMGDGLVLNTRLVEPTIPSIAHWADWSLTRHGFCGNLRAQPQLLFVKAVPECLELFLERYLPRIKATTRFVLITGDADTTLPRQVDQRFPDSIASGLEQRLLRLLDDPRLLHGYAENLDTPLPGVTPIPLGCINSDGHVIYRHVMAEDAPIPLRQRPLKAFCAHYVREGPQWEQRRTVMRLATGDWRAFVEVHEQIPYDDFFPTLQRYPFVICAGGGSLDPSPKAFTALLAGAIPIIERNPTTAAYGDLPVAYVDHWNSHSLSPTRLEAWRDALHPRFEDPAQHRAVLERMSMAHWLRRIRAHHPGT
ncbi:hypothetical protein [Cyanobium gracile]|uniref:Exostosin family protein n=1 Tax=Cyanobium gracile (strain ATCC 27147 / PCC 6307) TaxID=292564 RepID=K9P6M7_CYAGP|nr:hypothetical protein [Cyanobium gracile]AFY28351.1 hypothetical protein Cyagr_1172 [Cyanobium gracile PCC 6307]